MAHSSGDEGIQQQFFPPPQLDDTLLTTLQNAGLQIQTASQHSTEQLSSQIIGNRSLQFLDYNNDCFSFLRTGTCKFGPACKYNHPVVTEILVDLGKSNGNGVGRLSKAPTQMPCKFYPAGLCKYGEACKFKHTNTEEELPIPELNILGLPKRLGKMNCDFYIRTGLCSFGVSCRYNHPDPVMILYPESVNKRKQVFQSSKSRCSRISVPVMRSNSPIVHQNYAVTESQEPGCKQRIEITINVTPKREPCVLNEVGLPIRPGKKVCWNYEKIGLCKLGRACAYDHPEKHLGSTSASPHCVKT